MNKKVWLFLLMTGLFSCSLAYPSEIILPASQVQKGAGVFSFYWSQSDQDLSLQVDSRDKITVGSNSFFSNVTSDFSCKGRAMSLLAKVEFNPFDGFYYWLKAGSGSYELEIPSSSVKNKLSGQDYGSIVGFGMRSQLFPDTIVTPGVALEFGGTYSAYDLDIFRSGGDPKQLVSDKLELFEAQGACIISKKLRKFEPYGGLKVFRTYAVLADKANMASVSGGKDSAGLFAGTRIYVHQKESVVLEGNFVGETSFSLGWNMDF
jgi:hypothetical protein